MITQQCKDEIIDRVDCFDVLSEFLPLKRQGSDYVCPCPFHEERTASFHVNPRRNRWHCFGCQKDGDAIQFLIEHQNMTFSDALEWLARRYNVEVKYERKEQSEQERQEHNKRESALIALEAVQRFYVEQLQADTPEAAAARRYAYNRWGESFCKETGIGYAPKGNVLLDYAKQKGLPLDLLFELGVFRKSDTGNEYVLMRERITIPIRNRWGKPIAFTARFIGNDPDKAKYMNSPSSFLFAKDETLFGLDVATRAVKDTKCFIVVEGAPDVLRLQSIGLTEAVAPLGTALTTKHLETMRRSCSTIRFIPDSDPPKGKLWGAGVIAVMKHGAEAIRAGFDAYVKEIPRTAEDDKKGVKYDPDSFIVNREAYSTLEDKHFLVWLGEKRFAANNTSDANLEAMRDIADLLLLLDDEMIRDMCIDRLSKLFGKPKQWKDAVKRSGKKVKDKLAEDEANAQFSSKEIALMRKFGIMIRNNMYYTPGKDGELERLSNFIMIPEFHVKDDNGKRKFTIINEYGQRDTLDVEQKVLSSVQSFSTAVENRGNFVWLAKQDRLNKIKEYLYAITDTVEGISILGWQERGKFFAFANGIHDGKRFIPIDEKGTVCYGGERYYLPAFSDTYADKPDKYAYEKKIEYLHGNDDTLYDFVQRLIVVFGDGAKIGFAWVLACLFRDHIFKFKDWFPVLNLFGIRGSGKSAFAAALNSFFHVMRQDPPKLGNTSIPSLNYMFGHFANGIVVLDEYTNLLNDKVVDLLKGLFGGTTNTKMNMSDNEGGISTGKVYSGVIICGQHQPTKDTALFTRCIHLTYYRTSFSEEENLAFTELKEVSKRGNAHLIMEILRHREYFTENYRTVYAATRNEMKAQLKGETVDDRILDNWIAALSAFRTLETFIAVPYSYAELFEVCRKGIQYQSAEAKKTSETADFWKLINALHMVGKIVEGTHYRIKPEPSFRSENSTDIVKFVRPRKLLFLNWDATQEVLRQRAGTNQMKMDMGALDDYLHHLPSYLGIKQRWFNNLTPQGLPVVEMKDNVAKRKSSRTRAWVFDYEELKNSTNIDLESIAITDSEVSDDEEEPAPPEPKQADLFDTTSKVEDVPF